MSEFVNGLKKGLSYMGKALKASSSVCTLFAFYKLYDDKSDKSIILNYFVYNCAIHVALYLINENHKYTVKVGYYIAYSMLATFAISYISASKFKLNLTDAMIASCFCLSILDELGKDIGIIDKSQYTISNAVCDSIKAVCYKDCVDLFGII